MKNKLLFILISLATYINAAYSQETDIKTQISELVKASNEVFRYGYEQIDESEKAKYEQTIRDILQFERNTTDNVYSTVELTAFTKADNIQKDVMPMLSRIIRDVPELYIIASSVPRIVNNKYVVRLYASYTPEKYCEELKELDKIYETISQSITASTSTYEKLKILHDGFIEWGDYGAINSASSGNIKGALIDKKAVCEGFSRAYLYLCQRAGLKCMFVAGQLLTKPETDTWGNHAWNFVEIDGQWYLVDTTTDGGFPNMCGHTAFLRGQDYFNDNYRLEYPNEMSPTGYTNPNEDGVPTLALTTYDPTTITESGEQDEVVTSTERNIAVNNERHYDIYSITGKKIYSGKDKQISLPEGIYIIVTEGKTYKVGVR